LKHSKPCYIKGRNEGEDWSKKEEGKGRKEGDAAREVWYVGDFAFQPSQWKQLMGREKKEEGKKDEGLRKRG